MFCRARGTAAIDELPLAHSCVAARHQGERRGSGGCRVTEMIPRAPLPPVVAAARTVPGSLTTFKSSLVPLMLRPAGPHRSELGPGRTIPCAQRECSRSRLGGLQGSRGRCSNPSTATPVTGWPGWSRGQFCKLVAGAPATRPQSPRPHWA